LRDVQNGGSVLIAEGTADAHRQRIPIFGENVTDAHFYSRMNGFSTVGQMDAAHPAMKDSAGWADAKFYYASVVDPGHSRVVARLADGTPLLLDKQIGQGHVLLFGSGFENVTNDLPLHPAFVPFVDHAARYLSGEEGLSGARTVDSFVQLRSATNEAAAANQAATVEIVGPDGKRPLSLQEEARVQSFKLTHAGFYQMRFASGRNTLIAVNPDRRESGLELMPDDVLKLWSGNGSPDASAAQTASAAVQKNSAYSLWWWFMLLVLIAAVAESVLASRYLGTQREEV
jgi:hypothetical protein